VRFGKDPIDDGELSLRSFPNEWTRHLFCGQPRSNRFESLLLKQADRLSKSILSSIQNVICRQSLFFSPSETPN
jgi:hypothetical protein